MIGEVDGTKIVAHDIRFCNLKEANVDSRISHFLVKCGKDAALVLGPQDFVPNIDACGIARFRI
jgi:hypothetical protein